MNRKLYVGNLPYETGDSDLRDLFGRAGTVESVQVMRDMATGRGRGFAFVEMGTDEEAQKAIVDFNGREFQGFKWRYGGYHHITQSGWVCTRILAKAAAQLGADLTRDGFKQVLESRGWESGLGITLHWPAGDHNAAPYSFNREFIYKWVGASDGGWDVKRIRPDPVFDCALGNIPAEAKTVCNS